MKANDILDRRHLSTPAGPRPKALALWLRRKELVPNDAPAFEATELGGEMRKWWTSLMPKWRLPPGGSEPWPLQRNRPDVESWSKVRKVGPNGLFVVLLGLAWWRSATTAGQPSRREYSSVLEDVAWVMGDIIKDMVPFASRDRSSAPAPSAEPAASTDVVTTSKRGRTSRPSQKKLGSSGLSPARASKRARCV